MREKLGGYSYVPHVPYDYVRYDPPREVRTDRPGACDEAANLAQLALVTHSGSVPATGGQALLVLFETQSAAVKFRDREAECRLSNSDGISEEFRGEIGAAVVRRHTGDFGISTPTMDTVVVTYRGVDASVSCSECQLDLDIFARNVIAEIDAATVK